LRTTPDSTPVNRSRTATAAGQVDEVIAILNPHSAVDTGEAANNSARAPIEFLPRRSIETQRFGDMALGDAGKIQIFAAHFEREIELDVLRGRLGKPLKRPGSARRGQPAPAAAARDEDAAVESARHGNERNQSAVRQGQDATGRSVSGVEAHDAVGEEDQSVRGVASDD
jgi:hypothetical protein